jgi:formylglycine-generating enzyme required for sulfatase activity
MSISRAWTDLKQLGWSNQSLIDKPLTTPLDAQEHELAFAAIGDSISAYLDGKLVATVNNVSCQGSLFGLHAISPALLKDPEWQPLDENGKQAIQSTPSSKTAASATTEVFRLDSSVITKDKPFVNSIGMTLVPVPGTKVLMCVHPTRKRDFAEFAATDASLNTFWQYRHPHTMPETEVNLCPVSNGRKEGRAYRMPTDREWSLAVGIGHLESETATPLQLNEGVKGVFAWGTQWPPPANAGNLADTAATKSPNQQVIPGYTDGYSYLSPVMRFQPNELGLYDLAGNVFEWCEDWSDNQRQMPTMRGGAFNLFLPNILLASHRNHNLPERRSPNYGFRCVLDLSQASSNGTSNTSPDTPATPASAQKWIDNQGRSIIATFVRSDSVNVTLRMADGKEIPIALNRLSEESRRIASHLASITNPTTSVVSKGPFTNTLGMQLVPVPDTKVLVCIHETLRQDYAKFAAEFPGMDDNWARQTRDGIPVGDKDDHPVVGVNWESAKAFCEWLSSKEKRTYRLPTDREWSCAVGIGRDEASMAHLTPEKLSQQVKNEYPWGKSFPPPDRLGNLADRECGKAFRNQTVIGNYNDGYATTAPVMSFKPNKIGIYDLEGNVSEWCSDWYNEKMLNHVLRGGQWASFIPGYLLSSYRNQNPPNVYGAVCGFRIVLEIAP